MYTYLFQDNIMLIDITQIDLPTWWVWVYAVANK